MDSSITPCPVRRPASKERSMANPFSRRSSVMKVFWRSTPWMVMMVNMGTRINRVPRITQGETLNQKG